MSRRTTRHQLSTFGVWLAVTMSAGNSAGCGRDKPPGDLVTGPCVGAAPGCDAGTGSADATSLDEGAGGAGASDATAPACESGTPPGPAPAAEHWSWDFGDADHQAGTSIFAGPDGSVYLSGQFAGVVDIGGGAWQGSDSTKQPATDPVIYDTFIAKLDPTGRRLWSRRFPSVVSLRATTLAGDGNLVLGGRWSGSADFGLGPSEPDGDAEGFLVAYDACGNPLWLKRMGGGTSAGGATITSVSAARDGTLAITGTFLGTVDLGTGPLVADDQGRVTTNFAARLDAAGTLLWAKTIGAQANGLVAVGDAAGHTYVAGALGGSIDLGAGAIVGNPARRSVFVARLDTRGLPLWSLVDAGSAGVPGATGRGWARSLAVDAQDNLILGGTFIEGSVDLGGVGIAYVCCGDNMFVGKIDHAGGVPWLRSFNSWIGPVAVGPRGIVVAAQWDGYARIHTLDPTGTEIGTGRQWGGGGFSRWFGIAVDPWDRVLATGSFMTRINLGSGDLMTAGGLDMDGFVARLPTE